MNNNYMQIYSNYSQKNLLIFIKLFTHKKIIDFD